MFSICICRYSQNIIQIEWAKILNLVFSFEHWKLNHCCSPFPVAFKDKTLTHKQYLNLGENICTHERGKLFPPQHQSYPSLRWTLELFKMTQAGLHVEGSKGNLWEGEIKQICSFNHENIPWLSRLLIYFKFPILGYALSSARAKN